MVLSGILGDSVILLLLLTFLIIKAGWIRSAGHIDTFLLAGFSFFDFHRHIISALQKSKVSYYLILSCLQPQLVFSKFPVNHTVQNRRRIQ